MKSTNIERNVCERHPPKAPLSFHLSWVMTMRVMSCHRRIACRNPWQRGSFNATSEESSSEFRAQGENASSPESSYSNNSDKLFTHFDRKTSIDSETVYILFPVNYRGESTGPPRYIKWPRRKSEDCLDDLEFSSVSSDLSADFQDIDLSKPIFLDDFTSDEEFNVTPK
ncbi:hypothetical protein FSP39_003880 [Pinctada imbricata]|uniref:Uncharacterized protein n=1 Tax=Pinctada imbricata TaxID=66713 RepID=A0AA89C2W5_PINIB|nr:hypothetical protein FSP39_003880 [Pinctada imbricata]